MSPEHVGTLVQTILSTHHALLHQELPRLARAFSQAPEPLRRPFLELRKVLDEHLLKEEQILFPIITALAAGEPGGGCGVAGPVRQMHHEHAQIRALEKEVREVADLAGPETEALLALLNDLVIHAGKEDELLFPAAVGLEAGEAAEEQLLQDWQGEQAPPVLPHPGRILRQTRGVCSTCLADVPAVVRQREGAVYLEKDCPQHGITAQLLSRAAADWAELDRYYFRVNADERPQRDFIVRMTERCNLACPICLAKANTEDTPDLDLRGLETLLSERRGLKIDLMAAEPTLRADLEDWVRKVKATGNVAALHTNGLRLADLDYARKLRDAGVDEVFLQFDGLDDEANKVLRGRPLNRVRQAALANLKELGMATSLIVVVGRGINEDQVGATFRFALQPGNEHIREVFFLGLRGLGSARHSGTFTEQQLMPDEILDLLCAQEQRIKRPDVVAFNKLYFAMLSALKVKKCLYVQHYLVLRGEQGNYTPVSDVLDLQALSHAADHYADRLPQHPHLARAGLAASVLRQGLRPQAVRRAPEFLALEQLLQNGMNLDRVPRGMLLLGFITACDPDNFDASVAVNCGKGELSLDGGFVESGAVANVERERRFAQSDRDPGRPQGTVR